MKWFKKKVAVVEEDDFDYEYIDEFAPGKKLAEKPEPVYLTLNELKRRWELDSLDETLLVAQALGSFAPRTDWMGFYATSIMHNLVYGPDYTADPAPKRTAVQWAEVEARATFLGKPLPVILKEIRKKK